jgi:hypothetical protein
MVHRPSSLSAGSDELQLTAPDGSAFDPGRVETPFIPQKLQRMVVVHVDLTV